jgi:hypothetical protein
MITISKKTITNSNSFENSNMPIPINTTTQITNKSTAMIPNSKQNLNVIQLGKETKHTTSKSPETKYTLSEKNKIPSKGMNIIPVKQFTTGDKVSPRSITTKTATNFGASSSPKGVSALKFPQSTKTNANETRTQFEIKSSSYKSPSPNKGVISTSSKFLKKSPEVKK